MEGLTDILHYEFFQNALIGGLLASIVCGIIGTYIVSRRLVMISGGITHASFGGIGLGVLFGINPIFSAALFSILSACGIQWLSQRSDMREDSAIAVFWTFGMSVGIICCFLSPTFMPDLSSYLFGNILTITNSDILFVAAVAVLSITIFSLFLPSIVAIAFDRDYAISQNLPVKAIEYALVSLTALAIVSSLRMVGIVLVISLLTIPQMTANLFVSSYKGIILLSILIGYTSCIAGLTISTILNVPSGASIIFSSVIIYTLCKVFMIIKEKKG